ncbi:cysteine desulfurase family protein [Angustibacter aerolatus]
MVPEAVAAMADELARVGNPSSLHTAGRRARRVVEESREQLAAAVRARPSEVVLTSGGTESDNLAVIGTYRARRRADDRRRRVLVSSIEHHAVLDATEALAAHEGAEAVLLPVDRTGRLDVAALEAEIARDPASVALVSVMWANNEVGTLQPVDDVVRLAHAHGVPVHTDAVQAVGQVPVDFAASGVDLLTVTAHKLGGPVGVGALVAVRGAELEPLVHGGGQERGVRSGTLDAASARAFSERAEQSDGSLPGRADRVRALRDRLLAGVLEAVPEAELVGAPVDPALRLPGNLNVAFRGCEGDSLLYLLDAAGIECSTGSACQAGVPQPSHVLLAMGLDPVLARGALRLSLGHSTTDADVDAALAALPAAVERSRGASLATRAS